MYKLMMHDVCVALQLTDVVNGDTAAAVTTADFVAVLGEGVFVPPLLFVHFKPSHVLQLQDSETGIFSSHILDYKCYSVDKGIKLGRQKFLEFDIEMSFKLRLSKCRHCGKQNHCLYLFHNKNILQIRRYFSINEMFKLVICIYYIIDRSYLLLVFIL
jgi:hypothetical protein